MSKFKDNFSSESFYPDSNYYDLKNNPSETPVSEDQISNTLNLNGQIAIGLLLKGQMEGLR